MRYIKFEKINSSDYKIYLILKNEIKSTDLSLMIEKILKKFQKKLELKGFYKVIVYPRYFSLFLELVKIEDSFYSHTLDLKIEVDNEMNIYFRTDDYFAVAEVSKVYYFEQWYYALVDSSFDKILEKVEFGSFVFGDNINSIIDKSILI